MNNIQFVLKTQSCVCTLLLTTLCEVQLVVDSLARHELRVSALLHDTTMVNDDDFVGVLNSRQSVSYHQACTSNLRLVKGFLHHLNSKQCKRCLKLQFPQIRAHIFANYSCFCCAICLKPFFSISSADLHQYHMLIMSNAKLAKISHNEKSAQRDANTARKLAVARFGHRPPVVRPLPTGLITIHCAAKLSVQCNHNHNHEHCIALFTIRPIDQRCITVQVLRNTIKTYID